LYLFDNLGPKKFRVGWNCENSKGQLLADYIKTIVVLYRKNSLYFKGGQCDVWMHISNIGPLSEAPAKIGRAGQRASDLRGGALCGPGGAH
jgi:hypothetical protein